MKPRGVVLVSMLALGPTATSCAPDEPETEEPTALPPAPAVPRAALEPSSSSPTVGEMELPSRLRSVHEAADRADSEEERLHMADELLVLFRRIESDRSPHLVSVRQDLAARAANLLVASAPKRAKVAAEEGLALSHQPSILRANLFISLADAEEALGNDAAARSALLRAITINETLLESELKTP